MPAPRLSVCMIAKNEAPNIAQAIGSIAPLAGEIILIDTGSTDGTQEIARGLGALVHESPWRNDFSAARNISLDLARGEWILVLDADEAIAAADHEAFCALLEDRSRCYLLRQRHYIDHTDAAGFHACKGEYPEWERKHLGYYESWLCRLFPRSEKIRYEGILHELVEPSIERSRAFSIHRAPFPLHHYGHAKSDEVRAEKLGRYAALGAQKRESQETSRNCFELGVLKVRNKEYAEGAALLKRATELDPGMTIAWFNLGGALQRMMKFDDALAAYNETLARDPHSAETHGNMGLIFLSRGEVFLAEAHLKRSLELNPDVIPSYGALAQIYLQQRQGGTAIHLMEEAVGKLPRIDTLKLELARVYLVTGKAKEATIVFSSLSGPEFDPARYHYLAAKLSISERDLPAAARSLELCRTVMTEAGLEEMPLFSTAQRELTEIRKLLGAAES